MMFRVLWRDILRTFSTYHENQNLVLKFMSFNNVVDENSPNNLDKPVLLEGRLPEKKRRVRSRGKNEFT